MVAEYKPDFLLRKGKDPDEQDHLHHLPAGCQDLCSCAEPAETQLCGSSCEPVRKGSKAVALLLHTASEFLDMGKYLVLGAVAVGIFKLFMLAELVLPFQSNVYMAVGALMLLAILLSICSEADAFVAASFTTFPAAAQLSFMALGPMVDLKLIFMYGSVFRKRFVLMMIALPIISVFLLSLLTAPAIR
jgi:uncharacterized membrane protein YraQ (UPF0718 family)